MRDRSAIDFPYDDDEYDETPFVGLSVNPDTGTAGREFMGLTKQLLVKHGVEVRLGSTHRD